MLRRLKYLAKRTRGDANLRREFSAVRREINRLGVSAESASPPVTGGLRDVADELAELTDRLASMREELAYVGKSNETILRALGKRFGPFDVARPGIKERFESPYPWMVPAAVEHANSLLTRDMRCVEWGGGASTPYWCERVGVLHTYEADRGFALLLLDFMTRRIELADHWRLHFVGCNWASTEAIKRKKGTAFPSAAVKDALVADYATMVPDRVDAIFVDGAVREATLAATAEYVRRDKPLLVVVDNTDAGYVDGSLSVLDMSGYDRVDHLPANPARPDSEDPTCTTVFERKR
ncbi:MAG: hypothetical protein H0X61_14865 [Acidimicrobiia bacterium]|jgi:hypothetical protein|nr:hypothetical protein [Acidimicrobiia bacterium]